MRGSTLALPRRAWETAGESGGAVTGGRCRTGGAVGTLARPSRAEALMGQAPRQVGAARRHA